MADEIWVELDRDNGIVEITARIGDLLEERHKKVLHKSMVERACMVDFRLHDSEFQLIDSEMHEDFHGATCIYLWEPHRKNRVFREKV